MAFATVNDANCVICTLTRPRVGVWHGDLEIDSEQPEKFEGALTLKLAEQMTFQGFARRSGLHHGRTLVRLIGGAGKLTTILEPRGWRNVPLRIPLGDAINAAGERLSSSCQTGILNTLLPKWSRPQRGAGDEIGALISAVKSAVWRMLPDGTIWVGQETWPVAALEWQEIEYEPGLRRLELASDLPTIQPGQTFPTCDEVFSGHHVSVVEHQVVDEHIRHFIYFEDDDGAVTDRLKKGLTKIIQSVTGARLDTLALYPAKVVSQNADGTLELKPDDPRWPSYSSVPIRLGIPGASVKISAGRILLGFAGGDPRKPIAELWEQGATVTELKINGTNIILQSGSTPVAKEGSVTTGHTHTFILTAGPYAVAGTIATAVDHVATGAGSQHVKVP